MANDSNQSPVNRGSRNPRMRLRRQSESFHAGTPDAQTDEQKAKRKDK